jgi:hypothetical protein
VSEEGAGSVLGKAKKVIGGGGIQAYGVAVRGRKNNGLYLAVSESVVGWG